jgi:putative tricarboxylic transport membrane protein
MSDRPTARIVRPETLTAVAILIVAALFVIPTTELPPLSALLPAAMVGSLMLLATAMLIADQRRAASGERARPVTEAPRRALGALGLIVGYAIAVDFVGFYPCTIVSVPLVAWLFGYRDPVRLAVATAVVVALIYVIFTLAMSQRFPVGRLWS